MLTVCYMPGADLGVGDTTVNKADKRLCPHAACLVDNEDIKNKLNSLPDGRACYGDHEAGKGNMEGACHVQQDGQEGKLPREGGGGTKA